MSQWAFIGASTIAREWMLDAVRAQGAEVTAVLSRDAARGEAFAHNNSIPRAYTDVDKLLATEKPDAVYISTTNELHKEQCLAAAAAGAHVVCEKPLALTLTDAEEMVAACNQAGVLMATNHHLRAAAAHEKIRELLRAGAIGELIAVRVHHAVYLPPHLQGWRLDKPQAGGGVVLDITVHDADLLAYLVDDYPQQVTAMTHNCGMGKGVEDGAMSVWRYKNNVLCHTHESFTMRYAMTGLELHGTAGSVYAKDVLTQKAVGEVFLRNEDGFQKIEYAPRNLYEYAMARFCAAMAGQGRPLVDGVDGVRSLAVALAVLESARCGATVAVNYGHYAPAE